MINVPKNLPFSIFFSDDDQSGEMIDTGLGFKSIRFPTSSFEEAEPILLELDSPEVCFIEIKDNIENLVPTLNTIHKVRDTWPETPILAFSEQATLKEMNAAFYAGANDFLQKPLREDDIISRTAIRKEEKKKSRNKDTVSFDSLSLNLFKCVLTGEEGSVSLTKKESVIMSTLLISSNIVLNKKSLKVKVWGNICVTDASLDRKLFELRKKLKKVTNRVEIKSCYGKGILLRLIHNDSSVLVDDLNIFTAKLKEVKAE